MQRRLILGAFIAFALAGAAHGQAWPTKQTIRLISPFPPGSAVDAVARLVFDNDSVTNIAHQLGYYETIAGVDVFSGLGARIGAVTREAVGAAARTILTPSNRTIGWFDPELVS